MQCLVLHLEKSNDLVCCFADTTPEKNLRCFGLSV